MTARVDPRAIRIPADGGVIHGDLALPPGARSAVIFAHGSGSSRHSPRNRQVAGVLEDAGLATLLMDLLTAEEEQVDMLTREHRFDIGLLAQRLLQAIDWMAADSAARDLRIGLFGASTGAAAALVAAAMRPEAVGAVVSRGGRPDLADAALERVTAPTLLIVGGADTQVIALNEQARRRLRSDVRLELVPGATHLFEETGTLERVAELARDWFLAHLEAPDAG